MLSLGHPILGDPLYGGSAGVKADRLLLHAERLAFTHPVTGRRLAFSSAPGF
jgi:23S rRNA-/tRNA-specific pseudouridylate synthase